MTERKYKKKESDLLLNFQFFLFFCRKIISKKSGTKKIYRKISKNIKL